MALNPETIKRLREIVKELRSIDEATRGGLRIAGDPGATPFSLEERVGFATRRITSNPSFAVTKQALGDNLVAKEIFKGLEDVLSSASKSNFATLKKEVSKLQTYTLQATKLKGLDIKAQEHLVAWIRSTSDVLTETMEQQKRQGLAFDTYAGYLGNLLKESFGMSKMLGDLLPTTGISGFLVKATYGYFKEKRTREKAAADAKEREEMRLLSVQAEELHREKFMLLAGGETKSRKTGSWSDYVREAMREASRKYKTGRDSKSKDEGSESRETTLPDGGKATMTVIDTENQEPIPVVLSLEARAGFFDFLNFGEQMQFIVSSLAAISGKSKVARTGMSSMLGPIAQFGFLRGLGKLVTDFVTGIAATMSKALRIIGRGFGSFFSSLGRGLEAMGSKKALAGAASFLMLGTGLLAAAQAVNLFAKADWKGFGFALLMMGALVGTTWALVAVAGAAEVTIVPVMLSIAATIAAVGGALFLGAKAFEVLTNSLGEFSKVFETISIELVGKLALSMIALGGAAALLGNFAPLMIAGSLGLIVLGGALYAMGLGLKEFASIEWDTIGKGVTTLAALGGTAALIGLLAPQLLLAGIALLPLGLGLLSVALGLKAMALIDPKTLGDISGVLGVIGTAVTGIGLLSPVILLAGVSLTALGVGLLSVAAGIAALSFVDPNSMAGISGILGVIGSAVAGFAFAAPFMVLAGAGMLALGAGLLALAAGVGAMSFLDPKKASDISGILGVIGGSVAGFALAAPFMVIAGAGMLALGIGLTTLAVGILAMSKLSTGDAVEAAGVLAILGTTAAEIGMVSPLILAAGVALTVFSIGLGAFGIAARIAESPITALMKGFGVMAEKVVLVGKAFKSVVAGLKDFVGTVASGAVDFLDAILRISQIDSSRLTSVAWGIAAIGGAMAAFGTGELANKTFNAAGGVIDKAAGLLGINTGAMTGLDTLFRLADTAPSLMMLATVMGSLATSFADLQGLPIIPTANRLGAFIDALIQPLDKFTDAIWRLSDATGSLSPATMNATIIPASQNNTGAFLMQAQRENTNLSASISENLANKGDSLAAVAVNNSKSINTTNTTNLSFTSRPRDSENSLLRAQDLGWVRT